ncbi:hypothetical protein CIW52_16290 [Mycolicibacterium sp. P9-64]|nr:hypothetical protein CIW52_16290 [Mycolicibacterium sp. P9-64]
MVDHVQSGSADKVGSEASSTVSDDTVLRRSAITSAGQTASTTSGAQFSALSVPQVQTPPAPFDPVGALLALPGQLFDVASGFVALVITPFLAPTPNAPAQMPLLWTVLAWVRREISHTFFNRSPIANPVQISQTVGGEVTGNLNASDPNGDEPLTYTVTQQPAHGTVVVRPDGTYTYTPTAGAPTSTLTDSFTVTIDDSVGTQLPGVFGVVQGILHRLAQFIGIAQSDTTVTQVAVTVAGAGVNLPPLVVTSVINPIPYTVGSGPRVLDSHLTVVDGSSNLSGGTVSVGLGFSAGDTLSYTPPANNPITGSYDAATGVLTLSGTATVAQYQDALRAVSFSTTSDALIGARTVSFVVTDDGGLSSISVPLALTVLALNLPPVVTTSVVGPIVTAGNPPVTLDANVTIIDGSGSMTGAQVSLGLGFSAGDTLGYTAPQSNPITGSYNAATGVLTLSGTGTVAQYQEALRAVTFSTTSNALVGVRTVGFVVTDDGGLSSISVPLAVTVLALNLPPVVTTSVIGPIVTAGNPPVTLDGNVTIVDGSASMTGGTVSLGLGFSPGDTLGYTAPQNNPITGSYNAATGVLTLSGTGTVAQYQEALRAVTFSTTSNALVGVRTVGFVVTDDGGLSSISVPLAVTVLALNLPPVVTTSVIGPIVTAGNPPVTLDANVTIVDGSASLTGGTVSLGLGFSAGDTLGYTAPQDNPITGSYNAATGVLTLSGTGTVAQYQEALRAVTFSTTSNALVGVRTVGFVVTDDGGLSSISVPLAVTVLALNLPPVVTTSVVGPIVTAGNPPVTLDANVTIVDGSASMTGGTVSLGLGFGPGDTLGYTAPQNNPITGSYNAATGVLTLSGTGTVAQYQEALRAVTFSTTAGALVGVRTVGFVVTDVGGLSSISVPLAVTVLALNLPPVVTTSVIGPIVTAGNPPVTLDANVTIVDGSASLTGGTVSVGLGFSAGDTLGYTAPQNNPITGSYDAATGVLTLSGTGTVAQYQEALRSITFSTTAGVLVGARTVSFVVTDVEGASSISVPLAVTVLALNLPPVVTTSVVGPIVTAGNPPVTLDANVTIVDGSASLTGGTVSLGLGFSAGDTLGYTAPQDNPITGSYDAATGVLTLSGTGTVAQYQEALRSITFSTTAGALVGARTVSFVVTDVEGASSISVPLAVTVLALNLPPVVTTSVVGPLVTAGNPPVTLDANVTIVDGSASLTGGTVSLGLGFSAGDTLGYTAPQDNPITGSYDAATGVLTLSGTGTVAQYQEALRSITFSTTAGALVGARTVSFVVTDVEGASSISVPLAVTVLALNLPPVVTTSVIGPIVTAGSPPVTLDANVTIVDGSASLTGGTVSLGLGFSAGDTLGYTAPQNNPITGSYNSATGVLTLSGTGTVAQYQEALRSITFSTTAGALVGARTVSFVVTDVEGASSISVPLAVTVLALNLPPVVTTSVIGPIVTAGNSPVTLDANVTIVDGSASLTGGTVSVGLGFSAGDTLGYTAPQDNPITGSYDAATGVLTLSGTGTVAQYQEALRSITFSTTAGALVGARTVSFVVTDVEGASSISVPLAVTVLALNVPPVVVTSILNLIPFTAGNAPATLDPNLTVIDGSASLSGATVAITVGLTAGDSLAFTQPPGSSITGSYNSATGVLTLAGTGTVAQYQEALRSVTFATTTATLVGVRTVSFVVTDVEGLPSVSVPLAVTVALNLPPVVTSSVVGLSLNLLNDAPPKILDPGVLIVDDSSTLTGATVTVGGLVIGGNDTLAFTSPPGSGITGVWNAGTKTLTLSGAATVADYQTALRSVTFQTSGFLNLGARVVSFVVKDQQGQSSISVPLTVVVVGIL